jgi:eukaryotic-like serine/threonine-protein kinase
MGASEVKKCEVCGSTYDPSLSYCLNDGTPLVPADSMIGVMLDGRYRVDGLLGWGGMGVVYRVTHVHIDTEFAIKILHPHLVANQSAIERFRREAKAAGRIRHPNAIQVTDFGVTKEGTVYLVMELVDGKSLREMLRQEKTIDLRRAVSIMHQACAAVEAAHQSGVIHRDLKPDNIMIKRDDKLGKVKVLDFGIAKLREQLPSSESRQTLTVEGTVIGTPEYMSPEQCRGRSLDPRSDIYSLGTILYEMLCGSPPFTGDSPLEVAAKHLNEQTRPLRQVCPVVPDPIEIVVMRALEKDPAKRQSSAARFSFELMEALRVVKSDYTTRIADSESSLELSPGEDTPDQEGSPLAEDRARLTIASGQRRNTDQTVRATPSGPAARAVSDQDLPAQPPEVEDYTSENIQDVRGYATPASPQALPRVDAGTNIAGKLAKSPMLIAAAAVALIVVIGIVGYRVWFSKRGEIIPQEEGKTAAKITKDMALIPGGKFMMGRNQGGSEDERPAHEVEINPFYIDKFEVTNRQYKVFVDATNHAPPKNWENKNYASGEAMLPVTHVTWQDAADYAEWAGKRLPTEEEWEYVARGGSKEYLYPWGNEWKENYAYVGRLDKAGHPDKTKPAPIHSFENDQSPFGGVYDLAGNVSEWVQNSYNERYDLPPDRRLKIYRGGNFAENPKTNTHRFADFLIPPPDQRKAYEKTLLEVGFRCAKDADK